MTSAALRAFGAFDGLRAALLLTRDGLPLEMVGHGLRADLLAAEVASVAESARRGLGGLGLGETESLVVALKEHELMVFAVGVYYLAVLFAPHGNRALVAQIFEKNKPQLVAALGG